MRLEDLILVSVDDHVVEPPFITGMIFRAPNALPVVWD